MVQDPTGQITLAAIAFPLIALVTTYAIDSVGNDDSIYYRVVVGGLALVTILTGAIGALLALAGYGLNQYQADAVWYTFLSFCTAGFLTIIVIVSEVLRGVEHPKGQVGVLAGLLILLGAGLFLIELVPIG